MFEKFRAKESKPAKNKTPTLSCSKSTEYGNTFWINKKKKYLKKKRDQKNYIPATGNNANAIENKKKQNN